MRVRKLDDARAIEIEGLIERALRDAQRAARSRRGRIRCPTCRWEPLRSSLWRCDHCHHVWNTFETRGSCPGCGFQWERTQCHGCEAWSYHDAWYEPDPAPER